MGMRYVDACEYVMWDEETGDVEVGCKGGCGDEVWMQRCGMMWGCERLGIQGWG